jgi:hypothetical protein
VTGCLAFAACGALSTELPGEFKLLTFPPPIFPLHKPYQGSFFQFCH